MKKILFLPLLILSVLFTSCLNDMVEPLSKVTYAKTNIVFNVPSGPITRTASVNDNNWPGDTKATALEVVKNIYSDKLADGLSFFTTNYTVSLTNDKGGTIDSWNGSTTLSLTEKNTLTVTLTEKTEGAFPKFETATGWIDLSNLDLDSSTPAFTTTNYGGAIKITNITVSDAGAVNVTIQVNLEYASYLLIAPDANWSILTNVKGFKELKWGGSNGTSFNTYEVSSDKTWWYYWGHGNEYVWGKGALILYGFNLYSDDSKDVKVKNGYWYGLFASLNSAGEGDLNAGGDNTNPDETKTHTVGGENGITPTSNDVAEGGAIR